MNPRGVLPRGLLTILVVGALMWSTFAALAAAQGPPPGRGKKAASEKRPPYAGVKDPDEKRSLLEAWKARHKATAAPGGAAATDVGRASMVINSANTVILTTNTLGGTCDVFDVRSQNDWTAGHAYAAGAVVSPSQSFGNPNGFDGFNFQANNAGTSGATEPTWPTTGIGATVGDNGITWKAIAFDPVNFVGCTPMQLISRASGGAETVIAQEGDTLPDGSQLAGWAEFVAANASGKAAFRAALAGYPFSDRDDEGESGIFTAGPGAGALTRIAASSTTIGGRSVCGFSAMVGVNGSGQVVYDTYAGLLSINECDEDNHGLVRFTSGPGNQLLVQQGDSIGSPAANVIGFGKDIDPGGGVRCTTCGYQNFDGLINTAGHVPVVLNLSDGSQGVFILTGPGTATQIVRLPTGAIGPRTSINDSDQVTYRATVGGVTSIFRFTPPSTITTIASVGDTIGGQTISSLAAFTDINSSGILVFEGQVAGGATDAYFFWNGGSSLITTGPVTGGIDSLASEMITVNDSNIVAYVTGIPTGTPNGKPDEVDGGAEGHESGGLFTWTSPGPPVKLIAVGDVVGGQSVTAIFAQHTSFVRRQFNSQACAAMAYMVGGDDPEMDCTEGDQSSGCYAHGVQLFLSCAGSICPTITISPPTLPGATQGTFYTQMLTASPSGTYTFTETGPLPNGINLAPSGLLSGTPTAVGSFPITVTATDTNNCTGTQGYTLVVGAATQPSITLTPGLESIVVGTSGTLRVSINITQSTDTIVTLSSANTGIVTVPPTVTIPANQASITFTANGVTVGGPVTVTANLPASFGAPPATASVTVVAAPVAPVPTLSGWALAILAFAIAAAGVLLIRK